MVEKKLETAETTEVGAISVEALENSVMRAKEAFEKKAKDIQGKQYLVSGGKKTLDALFQFTEHDMPWGAQEALGVVTIWDRLKKAKEMKEPMLDGDAIEAIGYFVGKFTGKGYTSAKKFKEGDVFEPVTKMLTKVMQDKKELETLNDQWRDLSGKLFEMQEAEHNASEITKKAEGPTEDVKPDTKIETNNLLYT